MATSTGVVETAVIVWNFTQIDRNIVANAGIMLGPVIAAEMPAKPEKMFAFRVSLQHGARTHCNAGADLDLL